MSPAAGAESVAAVAAHARGSVFAIAVAPRGSRNRIEETADGALRVRVTAPPVDGAANTAALRLLADSIGVPRTDLEIVSGASNRHKRILVVGLEPDELEWRLRQALRRQVKVRFEAPG